MTDEQLDVARRHVDAFTQNVGFSRPNLKFTHGYIEDLKGAGIADESADMIISNCVVNLSPDKPSVLREAYRALAPGGEFYFSDVYADRRLPKHVQQHEVRRAQPMQDTGRPCATCHSRNMSLSSPRWPRPRVPAMCSCLRARSTHTARLT